MVTLMALEATALVVLLTEGFTSVITGGTLTWLIPPPDPQVMVCVLVAVPFGLVAVITTLLFTPPPFSGQENPSTLVFTSYWNAIVFPFSLTVMSLAEFTPVTL